MENIIKPKEKETPPEKTGKIFGIIRKKESLQNSMETSLTLSTSEMTKDLQNYEIEAELVKAKALLQSYCLTRLL